MVITLDNSKCAEKAVKTMSKAQNANGMLPDIGRISQYQVTGQNMFEFFLHDHHQYVHNMCMVFVQE